MAQLDISECEFKNTVNILYGYGIYPSFNQLSASADSFQNNVDSYLTDGVPSALVLLRQPFNIWNTIFPTEVNAFYQPSMNNICKYRCSTGSLLLNGLLQIS